MATYKLSHFDGEGNMILESGEVARAEDLEDILDSSGNELLEFDLVASAVNYVRLANSATGNSPNLSSQGSDANIGLTLTPKGTGSVLIDQDDNGLSLKIDAESTTADVLQIVTPATTTGKVILLDPTALTTGKGISVNSLDALTTGLGLEVESGATAITGAGRLFSSDHTGATSTSGILNEFKSAANDETVIVRVTASDVLAAGVALDVSVDAMTTGTGLDMGGVAALTTGKGVNVQSISEALTSGILLDIGHTGSGSNADVTGNVAKFASSITDTDTSGTNANDYDVVLISRTDVMNGAGGTMDADGACLKIESTATQTAGTLTQDVAAIEISHNVFSASDVAAIKINTDNGGAGAALGIDFSQMADGEALFKLTSTDTDLSTKSPETDAEAGWFPVDAAGTVYAVPIYALS